MRPFQSTLSCHDVCAWASSVLAGALATIGWVAGAASVEPLLLLQLLIRASAERRSLDAIVSLAQQVPCPQTVRNALAKLLPRQPQALYPVIARALHDHLPKGLKRRPRTMAIDIHTKPYYGAKTTPGIYRSQPKASTKNFFAYATLLVIRKGQAFTVGLVAVVHGDDLSSLIEQLLQQAAQHGLRPRRLLLDRGFYGAKVMQYLQQRQIPFVMPMIRRGKAGRTKKECTGTAQFFVKGRRGWTEYVWEARPRTAGRKGPKGPPVRVTTEVCMAPAAGRKGKTLVYACFGMKHWPVQDIVALYRRRFQIETSYRQMREALAQTCSKDVVYRLLLVLIALVLRNLWLWLHVAVLARRDRVGRPVLCLKQLRVRTLLHWLVQYLNDRLGIANELTTPNPAATAA